MAGTATVLDFENDTRRPGGAKAPAGSPVCVEGLQAVATRLKARRAQVDGDLRRVAVVTAAQMVVELAMR